MQPKVALFLVLICLLMSLTTSCQGVGISPGPDNNQAIKELRKEYPLYNNDVEGASVMYAPFETRIKNSDSICFATVLSDAKLFEVETEPPVNSKEFTDKHPNSTFASYYVYSIKIDDVVAGKDFGNSLLIFEPEILMTDYLLPKTGEKLFFTIKDGTKMSDVINKLQKQEELKSMPILVGSPVFYVTKDDKILSILNAEDMTTFDMTTKYDFSKKMEDLWNTTHKK